MITEENRIVITGSRSITDNNFILACLNEANIFLRNKHNIFMEKCTYIVGGARGVDKICENIFREHNLPVEVFLADWDKYGKSAGYKRNSTMAHKSNILISFWDGSSRGTKHMMDICNDTHIHVQFKYQPK